MGLKSNQTVASAPSPAKPRETAQVIEDLGFGHANLRYLVLAHGVWFVEASQMCLGVVLSVYVATEQGWTHAERASLLSLFFVGIGTGSSVGGSCADRYGRRPFILASYALAALVQLLMIASNHFWIVGLLRLCLGFAHGLGMPPSLALVSETAPKSRRVLLQGLRSLIASTGGMAASGVCLIDDPSYLHMHWRHTLLVGVIPPAVLFVCAAAWLHDSPTLLVHLGRDEEAKQCLEVHRRLNGRDGSSGSPAVDIAFVPAPRASGRPGEARQGSFSWQQQVQVIFGRHLLFSTVALLVASFSLNCVLFGHTYAFPLIATAKAATASMTPGLQSFMQSSVGIPVNIIVMGGSMLVSRPKLLGIGGVTGIAAMIGFATTAGLPDRQGMDIIVYYGSQNLVSVSAACGFLATYQLAVELYPVQISATSASLIVVAGRLGSILISYVYEMCDRWEEFYFLLAGMSSLCIAMPLFFLTPVVDVMADTGKLSCEELEAAKPLVVH